ncbi:putative membrane protein [Campylobacter blaseri]|nr:putative membrane protein [Campylobacter blaseri]
MKEKKKIRLFDSPIKQFIWVFIAIHLIGIGLNIILYLLKIPSGIETIINASPIFITLAIICYIVFNVMLYTILKIRFLISQK